MRPPRLGEGELADRLATLPGWRLHEGRLEREFVFRDFPEAFAFMTRVAFRAEQLDHHPDWYNVYNRVRVTLHTHDVGGVTELDLRLAAAMDEFAGA